MESNFSADEHLFIQGIDEERLFFLFCPCQKVAFSFAGAVLLISFEYCPLYSRLIRWPTGANTQELKKTHAHRETEAN